MTDLEKTIVQCRKEGNTYGNIQLECGNPSKKFIKDTLLKYAPELAGDLSQKQLDELFEKSLKEN